MPRKQDKVGLWLIGACGGVGSAVALGVAALARKAASPAGLVSMLPAFHDAALVDPGRLVVGGHEIRGQTLLGAVRAAHQHAGLFGERLIDACKAKLQAFQRDICGGTLCGCSDAVKESAGRDDAVADRSAAAAVERLAADIDAFRRRHRLGRVVVVHVASAEASARGGTNRTTYKKLQAAMARGRIALPASGIYALAAVEAGAAYVNFTSSPGLAIAAVRERADELGAAYMGRDGKTGETLVKSALAPMFAMRNLPVLSWVGQNILGNRDGATLEQPAVRASKVRSKDRTVRQIVGPSAATRVSIDFVPSLDDWKVAWNFVHFEGFLGTKMSLQFTWQGSDSVLAAPLVIDLGRFAALELQRGNCGPMKHLAFFFKDPMDVSELDLFSQWRALVRHVAGREPVR